MSESELVNPYEKLGNVPLGRVERMTLLDVAHTGVERVVEYVEKAYEGMKQTDAGEWEISEVLRELKRVKVWLGNAMKKIER